MKRKKRRRAAPIDHDLTAIGMLPDGTLNTVTELNADEEQADEEQADADKEMRKEQNWHKSVMLYWNEGSVEQRAEQLSAIYAEYRGKPLGAWPVKEHVLRKLALDVMCASFPPGHPPPKEIVEMMRRALRLSDSHKVGPWWDWQQTRSGIIAAASTTRRAKLRQNSTRCTSKITKRPCRSTSCRSL